MNATYMKESPAGLRYLCTGGYWADEREVCHHCEEQCAADGVPYRESEERNSFGCYAGRYCDECWPNSGFHDACDPNAVFDPCDCGESMEGID